MEKEANLLRCSKLNCYGEFNRMVQAITRNRAVTDFSGVASMKGTSAEYHFYTTLVLMLKGIVNNTDPADQKRELQQVYKWFCLNKPLIKSKTKPTHSKPKVRLVKRKDKDQSSFLYSDPELDRPQTAPAMLDQVHSFVTSEASRRRPHTYGSRKSALTPTFTSSYISRSLSRDLDLIGQPLDQLQLDTNTRNPGHDRPFSSSPFPEGDESIMRTSPTIIEFPTAGFLAGFNPLSGQAYSQYSDSQRPATVGATPMTIGTVFSLAPNVAAQMTLRRELNQQKQAFIQRRVGSPQPHTTTNRPLVNTPSELHRVPPPQRNAGTPESKPLKTKQEEETDSLTSYENQNEIQVSIRAASADVPSETQAADYTIEESEKKSDRRRPPIYTRNFRHLKSKVHDPDIASLEIKGRTLYVGESGKKDSTSATVKHKETTENTQIDNKELDTSSDGRDEDMMEVPISSLRVNSPVDEPVKVEDQNLALEEPVKEQHDSEEKCDSNSPLHAQNENEIETKDPSESKPLTTQEDRTNRASYNEQPEAANKIPETEIPETEKQDVPTDTHNEHNDSNGGNDDRSQSLHDVDSSASNSKLLQSGSIENIPLSPRITIQSPAQKMERSHSSPQNHQQSATINVVSITFGEKFRVDSNTSSSLSGAIHSDTSVEKKKGPYIYGAGFNKRRYRKQRRMDVPVKI